MKKSPLMIFFMKHQSAAAITPHPISPLQLQTDGIVNMLPEPENYTQNLKWMLSFYDYWSLIFSD